MKSISICSSTMMYQRKFLLVLIYLLTKQMSSVGSSNLYTRPHLFFLVASFVLHSKKTNAFERQSTPCLILVFARRWRKNGIAGSRLFRQVVAIYIEIDCLKEFLIDRDIRRGSGQVSSFPLCEIYGWDVLVFIISSWAQEDRYFALMSSFSSKAVVHSFSPWGSHLMTSLPFHTSWSSSL